MGTGGWLLGLSADRARVARSGPHVVPRASIKRLIPQQVIGTGHPVEGLLRPLDPPIACLPQAPDRLDPAKDLLDRIKVLSQFYVAGVPAQATISPLMPIEDPYKFAESLSAACHRVIVDHYLIGDGSGGLRTRRTDFIQRLEEAGFSEWTKLEKLWGIREILCSVLGEGRVLVSCEGFNSAGLSRCKEDYQVGHPQC